MFYHDLSSFFEVVSKYYLCINRFNLSLHFAWCSESGHLAGLLAKFCSRLKKSNYVYPPPRLDQLYMNEFKAILSLFTIAKDEKVC